MVFLLRESAVDHLLELLELRLHVPDSVVDIPACIVC